MQELIETVKIRENEIVFLGSKKTNTQGKQVRRKLAVFDRNSPAGQFIEPLLPNILRSSEKEEILSDIAKLSPLQKSNPKKFDAEIAKFFLPEITKLFLKAADLWDDEWEKFDFQASENEYLCKFILSCSIEELKKHKDFILFLTRNIETELKYSEEKKAGIEKKTGKALEEFEKYTNIIFRSKEKIIASFGSDSHAGKFITHIFKEINDISKYPSELKKIIYEILRNIIFIQETNPYDEKAFNAQVAKLGLIAAGFGNEQWVKQLNFNNPKKHAAFYNFISTCTLENLSKYKDIISTEKFQKNPHKIANKLKLFLSKNIQDKYQKTLFDESLRFIVNKKNKDMDKSDRNHHLAKLTLIAAGLWNEVVPDDIVEREFSDIVGETADVNPDFCEFVAKLDTKTLNAKWLKEFLSGMINFPAEKIKKNIEDPKKNAVPQNFGILSYPVRREKNSNGKKYWVQSKNKAEADDIFYIAIDYRSSGSLGSGSFGTVKKGYLLDNKGNVILAKPYAVKITHSEKNITQLEVLKEESNIIRISGLPFTLEPFKINNNQIVMPIELAAGKTLSTPKTNDPKDEESKARIKNIQDKFKHLSFAERVRLIREIAVAVTSLHQRGIIHGDIKWENILIEESVDKNKQKFFNVTFIDFGLSVKIGDEYNSAQGINPGLDKFGGTPVYAAPEIVDRRGYFLESDIYALTPIFASIFGAENPFYEKNILEGLILNEFDDLDIRNLVSLLDDDIFEEIKIKIVRAGNNYKNLYFTPKEFDNIENKLNEVGSEEAENLILKLKEFESKRIKNICLEYYDFKGIWGDFKKDVSEDYQYIWVNALLSG